MGIDRVPQTEWAELTRGSLPIIFWGTPSLDTFYIAEPTCMNLDAPAELIHVVVRCFPAGPFPGARVEATIRVVVQCI